MKPTDFSKLISDFLSKYLTNEIGASINTIHAYRDAFLQLIRYMEGNLNIKIERITIEKITKQTIIGFLDWLQSAKNCSNSTRNARLAAIHSFYKYVQYVSVENLDKCQEILSIRFKRTAQKTMTYLTLEGMELLLNQPDPTTRRGLRDLAMLSLMYDSGCRVQEVIDLSPDDLRISKNSTIKLTGKGNKARLVPMLNSQVDVLKSYIKKERLDNSVARLYPLFSNSRGEKLTRSGVSYIVRKYFLLAKKQDGSLLPEKMSCHTLRHSKAMHLQQAGVNLVYIRDILGHVSIKTTEIYARADSKQKREALEKASPNINLNEKPLWTENENMKSWLKSI